MTEKEERILIIDDEATVRRLIHAKLSSEGYYCHEAASAKQALDKLEKNPIDLVILDILMPDKSGMQFLPEIRERYPDIPVIMATAITDTDTSIQCIRQGAYDYVTKPFNLDELVVSVERALEMRRLRLIEYGEQYKIMFESSNDVLLFVDRHGKVLDVNEKGKEIGGYEKEDFVGKNIRSFTKLMPKRSLAKVSKNFLKRMAGFSVSPYTVEMATKNGKLLTVEINAVAIKREGKIIGDLAILRDITERKQAKKELQSLLERESRSAREWQELFDSSIDIITLTSPDFEILRINRAGYEGVGKKREELIGKNCYEVIHGLDSPIDGCPRQECIRTKKTAVGEVTQGGRHYLATVSPILDENGGLKAFAHSIKDITERKQAEHSLSERVKELGCLYGIASIAGRPGITLDEVYQEVANLLPNSWQYPEIACTRVAINGKRFETENYREAEWKQSSDIKVYGAKAGVVEINYLEERPESDEGPFLKEERLLINAVAERLGKITERKQAEKALRESEERYRALVDLGGAVGEAIVMRQDTEQGEAIQTFVSDEWSRITGYSREELLGMPFLDLLHPKYRKASLERQRRKIKGETMPGLFEMSIIRKDGTEVPIELTSAYTTHKGKRATVAYIRDITERKHMEEKERETQALKRLEQLQTELLTNVSHELRTPLATIKGYSTLLLHYDRKLESARKLESLEYIDEATDRLTELIDQLLDASRLEAGLYKPERQFTDIQKMLGKAVAEAKLRVLSHRVQRKFDKTLPWVNIDATRIQQVLNNLIDNAVKYSPEGSAIVIEAREAESEVVISVTDRGVGIPAAELDKIFNRMYRYRQRLFPEAAGTGLGLAICMGLVKAHGGRIWVETEVEKGSTFYFSLPKQTMAEGHSNGKKG